MSEHLERQAKGRNRQISHGIGIHVSPGICTAKHDYRASENEHQKSYQYACDDHSGKSGVDVFPGFFYLACSLIYAEIRCGAQTEEHTDARGQRHRRKCHVGCSVSQHSHHVSDEDLVRDVVCGSHQHADDGWDGKFGYQRDQRSCAQRILFY